MTFERRDVPIEQCACPYGDAECEQQADGEDRLCVGCRKDHDPDRVGIRKGGGLWTKRI